MENEKYFVPILQYCGPCKDHVELCPVELTEDLANKMFDKWVHRLHLEGWNIAFKWRVREKDMSNDDTGCMGITYSNFSCGEAEIRMLDPTDQNYCDYPYDYEKTLVHELLHLKFMHLDDTGDNLRDKMTHRLIDDMAKALVDAERSCPGC